MTNRFFLLAALASFWLVGAPAQAEVLAARAERHPAVRLTRVKAAGVVANVVKVDLNCPAICLVPIRAEDLGQDYATFGSFVRNWRPLAAINGTFFDTRTASIICNLVSQGRLITPGQGYGNSLVIDWNNQAALVSSVGDRGAHIDWSRFDFGVSSGPTLVRAGRIAIDPKSEGFHDPALFRQARRSALGITADNQLLMVTVNQPVSLGRLARMMQSLGARQALNLDGGSSAGLYCRGRYPTKPRRMMTNLLLVKLRDEAGPAAHRVDELLIWLTDPPANLTPSLVPNDFSGPAPVPGQVELAP